jgi:uncharacterized protein involved in exopolysaccharide biosynthesis/Mrp family chromosome partitioning ATPase
MNNVNNNRHHEPALGFSLADIYFILFRRKKAIVLLTLLGMLAGAGYFFSQQPPFQSDAKLLIKYISETHGEEANQKNTKLREAGDQSGGVLLAEAEIMSSFDLFRQVATNVGPEKILAKIGGGKDPILAAAEIKRRLKVMPGKESGILAVTFTHPDPDMCKPVLAEIIQDYIDMSHNVHAAVGASDESLQEKINSLRLQINQIDDEIRIAKTNAGIVDLAAARKSNQDEVDRLTREINVMETEVVGLQETLNRNAVVPAVGSSNNATATAPAAEIARYKNAVSRLAMFQKKEDEYLFVRGYTESNKLVLEVRENIAQVGKIKTELEEKFPALAEMVFQPVDTAPTVAAGNSAAQSLYSPARVKKLQSLMGIIKAQAMKLDDAEARINELSRKKQTLDDSYKLYTTQLQQNEIRNTFGPGQISNIVIVESPTPPSKNLGKYYKVIGALLMGGLLAGLFWAFFLELYVDRTVKRASEIETKLHIPFFLAIPAIGKSDRKLLSSPSRQTEFGGPAAAGGSLVPTANLEVNSALVNHALDSHYDALRDRLVLYFESINLTRKPKLVAVTSAGRGAGVSTIASGLAASLSETGDGRVLLVDMNQENGGAQQFFNGKANCKLDDALLRDKRDEALVQERLYVVSEGSASDKLSRVLPKRFAALVPQLKASDYDYIIFDMPPVSQTSITTRLAGFMDTVMLVIESEKTDRDTVQQANALLTQSKANVTAVLNKTKQHVPGRLTHDINAKF